MHGVTSAFGVSDRKVASILEHGRWPADDIQAWDDKDKSEFVAEYMGYMPRDVAQEVVAESICYMAPNEVALVFTDQAEFSRELSGHMYLYMEPHLSDQLERARKLLEEMAA
jgi:hypothetical protein